MSAQFCDLYCLQVHLTCKGLHSVALSSCLSFTRTLRCLEQIQLPTDMDELMESHGVKKARISPQQTTFSQCNKASNSLQSDMKDLYYAVELNKVSRGLEMSFHTSVQT